MEILIYLQPITKGKEFRLYNALDRLYYLYNNDVSIYAFGQTKLIQGAVKYYGFEFIKAKWGMNLTEIPKAMIIFDEKSTNTMPYSLGRILESKEVSVMYTNGDPV